MKFWNTTLAALLLIGGLLAGLIFHIFHISTADKETYQEIMAVSNSKTSLKTSSSYSAKQLKEGTSKTLLLTQGDERKIGLLSCKSSTLYFAKEEQSAELIEEMQNVQLIYQEELLLEVDGSPFQLVTFMDSDAATYFYNKEKLEAEKVRIRRYKFPSHELPDSSNGVIPLFSGTADRITVAFGSNQLTIQASRLKAVIE